MTPMGFLPADGQKKGLERGLLIFPLFLLQMREYLQIVGEKKGLQGFAPPSAQTMEKQFPPALCQQHKWLYWSQPFEVSMR